VFGQYVSIPIERQVLNMLEEMQHCLLDDEHAAERDGSGQKKNNAEALPYQHWSRSNDEKDHALRSHNQKEEHAAEHFTRGVLIRGEGAKSHDGKLPPGATHEIVETKKGEPPKIRRRRFSLK
jgi:hypothetical protein